MSALLFGSISTLIDTSELQRQAFNTAFTRHDLDWQWSREDYRAMLATNGGADRIADFAAQRGESVDSDAVHTTKSEVFRDLLRDADATPRSGVTETIAAAKSAGLKVGVVTTTSEENVTAVLSALEPAVERATFDLVVDSSAVTTGKPDKSVYVYALDQLGETADHVIAVEDNVGGVQSADAAGIRCVAFPNENTSGGDFAGAIDTVATLEATAIVNRVQG